MKRIHRNRSEVGRPSTQEALIYRRTAEFSSIVGGGIVFRWSFVTSSAKYTPLDRTASPTEKLRLMQMDSVRCQSPVAT